MVCCMLKIENMKEKIDIGTTVWVVMEDTVKPELVKGTIKSVSCVGGDYIYCVEFDNYFVIADTSNIFTDEVGALRRYSESLERYLNNLIDDAQEIITTLQRKHEQINEVEEQFLQCLIKRGNKILNK